MPRHTEIMPKLGLLRRWSMLVTAFVVLLVSFSFGLFSLPVFYPSLTKQFGWTHAEAAAGGAIVLLLIGGLGPAIGWLVDRYSPKNVLLAGACTVAASLVLLSRSEGLRQFYGSCLMLGIGSAAVSLLPTSLLIAPLFSKQRGLAVGTINAGVGLGGFLAPLISGTLIRTRGTSHAFEFLSFCMAVPIVMILVIVWRTSGEERAVSKARKAKGAHLRGRAGAMRLFWMFGISLVFAAHSMTGIQQHIVLFLTGRGISPGRAALALSILLGMSALGKVLGGAAADKFSARISMLLSVVFLGIGIVGLLVISPRSYLIFWIAGIFGLGFGGVFNAPPLIAFEYFGIDDVGTILGWFMLCFGAGTSTGALVSGLIYDRTGSYFSSFAFDLAMAAAAFFLLLAIGRKPEVREPVPSVAQ
ncbi:MAG: MFS transporter [Acidobacteriia bacterium]|nr:MFS transporter [Terriglobia bacterium]